MLRLLAAFALSATASAACPQGTFDDVNRTSCIAVVAKSFPWRSAEKICQVYGGHLASVADCDVNSILKLSVTNSSRVEYWLGGRSEEGRWNWTDGSELNYANWAEGEPSISHDRCVAQDPEGTWHARDCQQRKPFICRIPTLPEAPTSIMHLPSQFNSEIPKRNSCDAGWSYSDATGKCYKLVKNVKYTEAWRTCSDINSTTPSVRNARENEWYSGLFRIVGNKVFVGLVFNAADGKWVWMDGYAVGPWYGTRGEP